MTAFTAEERIIALNDMSKAGATVPDRYLEGLFLCTPKYANMWYVVAKYQNEPLGWSEQTDEEFKGKIPLWFRNKYPLPENYIAEFLDDNNYFIDLSSRVK